MTVLDVDLDFFVSPTVYDTPEHAARPDDRACTVWGPAEAEGLMRRLGATAPLPGALCEHHVEALWAWNRALYEGRLVAPFAVVHVDAHEDLGYGDPLWIPLQEEVLLRPVWGREFEQVAALAHSGNYLLCAVALGWVSELTLVLPGPLSRDPALRLAELSIHPLHWLDGDETSGMLQLRSAPPLPARAQADGCRTLEWAVLDPPVPVRVLLPEEVEPQAYDFLTVARSPAFCPPKADALLPLLTAALRPLG